MQYWLVKTEPGCWSWTMQENAKTTNWDGVRNYQASNNLKAMKNGDLAFFYHSVSEKSVVGVVRVVGEYEPDPTDSTGRFGMVRMEAVLPFKKPVTLETIKGDPRLQDLALIKQSRLSVMPISTAAWEVIASLGETKI
ncbi:MAG: EVE domain-containing protein [Alphaproteobacteria bacterium]|nr:EVE domain-containing protein [Alphaproteobacteria bacterium]